MEFLMRRCLPVLGILALVIAVAGGCGSKYSLKRDRLDLRPAWPFMRGEQEATGSRQTGQFVANLDVLWRETSNDKPAGPLTIYHGSVVYPGTKKKIRFFDTQTGKHLGSLKTKAPAQTGLVMQDSVAFFGLAPRRNELWAVDLVHRRRLMKVSVKDPAPGSIIVSNRLLISSGDGSLTAYNVSDCSEAWRFKSDGKLLAAATYGDGKVFQPSDEGILYALSPEDGSELYQVATEGPLVSTVAFDANVFVTDVIGNVYAFDPDDGHTVWRTTLGEPLWGSPAVADGRVFVGRGIGEVVALDAATGEVLWRFDTDEAIEVSPVVVDRYVVAGTLAGSLFLLDVTDGQLVDKAEIEGPIAFAPVTDGERIYVASQYGRILCLGKQPDSLSQADH
jgi:outer membrane protein assembly factor BamB